jgi:hypothetical protein
VSDNKYKKGMGRLWDFRTDLSMESDTSCILPFIEVGGPNGYL